METTLVTPEKRSFARSLLLPILLLAVFAGGLRALVIECIFPIELRGDELYYLTVADEIAAGHGHVYPGPLPHFARRPPLQAWVLSRVLSEGWNSTKESAQIGLKKLFYVEASLGTLLVVLTCLLARAWFGARAGWLAGAIAACDPTLVAFSHYLWCETLFAVLVTGGLLAVIAGSRSGSWLPFVLGGLAFGAATLTREVALPVAAACAAWLVVIAPPGFRTRALRRGVLLVGLAVAVVLPWTWRNYSMFHRIVPVSTIGWPAAAEGNTLDPVDWFRKAPDLTEMHARIEQGRDEIERSDLARRYTLELVRADQPAWIFKRLVRNTALLLSPDSYLLLKLREGRYDPIALGWKRLVEVASVLLFVLVFVLGCIGFASETRPYVRILPGAIFCIVLALHVLTAAVTRYRVPWMPIGIAFASAAALDLPGALRRTTRRGRMALAAVLFFFVAFCVPYDREGLAELWRGQTLERRGRFEIRTSEPAKTAPSPK
jgi:4-amino-4-deoxy-L-arabinose transferase-like glycosyltransferase